jgi:hypothetical protein
MPSSRVLSRVTFVRTDVSEKRIAVIISVTRIGQLGTTIAVTNNRSKLQKNIPEVDILHSHRHENLNHYITLTSLAL